MTITKNASINQNFLRVLQCACGLVLTVGRPRKALQLFKV